MPQLDTIHMFTSFLWTWFTLYMIMKKTKAIMIASCPKNACKTTASPMTMLPWT